MNRYWSGLVAAGAVAMTVGLGAQGQNPANTPPPDAAAQPGTQRTPPAPSAQDRTPNTITVTGCLQSAPAMTASADARGAASADRAGAGNTTATGRNDRGAAGVGATASANTTGWVLNNATMSAGGGANRGAVGTTGTAATSYRLEGDVSQISPHLNHQVQITGRLQSSAASPTGAANAAPGSTAAGPTLMVESVTMLDANCAPAVGPQRTTPRNPGGAQGGGNQERPTTQPQR